MSVQTDSSTSVLEGEELDHAFPEEYEVIMLNDDFTPMDFVVDMLISIFHKNPVEATRLMLLVHTTGRAVVGVYTYDIASTKINEVHTRARAEGYPLKCIMKRV